MKIRFSTLLFSSAALGCLPFQSYADDYYWSSVVESGDWNVEANWSGIGIPGTGDRALFKAYDDDISYSISLQNDVTLERLQFQTHNDGEAKVTTTFGNSGEGDYKITLESAVLLANDATVIFNVDFEVNQQYLGLNTLGTSMTFSSGYTLTGRLGTSSPGTLNIDSDVFDGEGHAAAIDMKGGTLNWNVDSFVSTNYNQKVLTVSGRFGEATMNIEQSLDLAGAGGIWLGHNNNSGLANQASVFGVVDGVVVADTIQTEYAGTAGADQNILTIGANDTSATVGSPTHVTFSGDYIMRDGGNARIHQFHAAEENEAEFSGVIGDNATSASAVMKKTGTGTVIFSGSSSNTYTVTGAFEVAEGTLRLAKDTGLNALTGDVQVDAGARLELAASNQIVNTADMTLAGGTFDLGNNQETLGSLSLTGDSVLELEAGASVAFAASSALWGAEDTLTIVGLLDATSIRFGTDAIGLSGDQLSRISFANYSGFTAQLDESGYLSAIPEPGSFALIGGFLALTSVMLRRR